MTRRASTSMDLPHQLHRPAVRLVRETMEAIVAATERSKKVATLSGRELGFQVVDSNDEGDRAIGVIGYRLGKTLAYVPVIFDDAEVKGAELLYLPSEDLFLRNSEEWLNELLSKASNDLGRMVKWNTKRRRSQSALWQLKDTPEKTAETRDRLMDQGSGKRGGPTRASSTPDSGFCRGDQKYYCVHF